MRYDYNLVGICIRVELPFSVQIMPSATEFLVPAVSIDPDLYFSLEPVDVLPGDVKDGYELENQYHTQYEKGKRVYYLPAPHAVPYACVEYPTGENRIRGYYLRTHQFRFVSSMDISSLMGLESVLTMWDSLLLHSAFIRWKGNGILFSAPSGVGKSTQADLWNRYRNADILNGDRAGVRLENGQWWAYGLPIAGSSHVYRNESARVKSVIVLEQAPVNEIQRMSPVSAFRKLYPEITVHTWDAAYVERIIQLLTQFISDIPIFLLRCRPDEEAVRLVENEIVNLSELDSQ